ncbi:N-acetyltransferase 9-like isoform X3 [Anneissia japonica]|uniref:N-acetyltransferase 9-like isoform X3 n=1 Tax=Anneissia japonica TaxID=1529436 RepID=UPI001425B4AD|nr:N-acetyltransferase 9-like isoform X3 [Anneissia japonica]
MPRYHSWMMSEELQELTASEPLTLEEEYQMQRSWHVDEDKCTFIVLDKVKRQQEGTTEEDCMCGDVNLFLNDQDDRSTAEVEIMIAEKLCRGKGFGKEALLLMMQYGVEKLDIKKYTAKIGSKNTPSQEMFKKLGFKQVSFSEVFQEVTLEFGLEAAERGQLKDSTKHMEILEDYIEKR